MSGRFRRGRRRGFSSGFRRTRSYSNMRTSMAKRSRGNLRAASHQNDTSDVVINLIKSVSVGVSGGVKINDDLTGTSFKQGVCALNVYDLLRKSDFYNSYANMYDQFRITSIKVKITPTKWSAFNQQMSLENAKTSSVTNIGQSDEYNVVVKNYMYNPRYLRTIPVSTVADYDAWVAAGSDPNNPPTVYNIEFRYLADTAAIVAASNDINNPLYLALENLLNDNKLPTVNSDLPRAAIIPGGEGNYDANEAYINEDNTSANALNDAKVQSGYVFADDSVGVFGNRVSELPITLNTNVNSNLVRFLASLQTSVSKNSENVVDGTVGEFIYPQAFTIVTAWDRTGLDTNQMTDVLSSYIVREASVVPTSGYGSITNIPDDMIYDGNNNNNNNQHREYCCINIGDEITSYSSAQTKQLVPGASFNLMRYLYPSSNQEKSVYYSTSSLREQLNYGEITDCPYVYQSGPNMGAIYDERTGNLQQPSKIKSGELCNLLSDPTIPFKPTLLIGILGFNDAGCIWDPTTRNVVYHDFIKAVKFNLEFDIGVTFRGLRKSQVV